MLGKFIGFTFLWYLLGSPILALLVLLVILYVLDRRFLGLTPSLLKPFRVAARIRKLRQELRLSPHDTSVRVELARRLLERRRYKEAAQLLREALGVMEDSADIHCELGYALLKQGQLEEGRRHVEKGLELNPRAKYGEPHLWLGEALAERSPSEAAEELEKFRNIHSSSCEAGYRLGRLYVLLGREDQARKAFREAAELYRSLPRYKKRSERRWALLSWLRSRK